MVVVPDATPVTTPPVVTVATAVLLDTHGLTAAGVAEPVKVELLPTQALSVPEIVGNAFTVNAAVAVQPLLLV